MGNWIPRNLGYAPRKTLGNLKDEASKKKVLIYGSDTQEQIDHCLNCTKPANACHGCGEGIRLSTTGKPGRPSKYDRELVGEMLEAGATQAEIASAFGVSRGTAAHWVKKYWREAGQ